MSDRSTIEWTDASWNPIRAKFAIGKWACLKISPGCDNCYASTFNRRMGGEFYLEVTAEHIAYMKQQVEAGNIYLDEKALVEPLRWTKARRVFVCSMTDIAGEWVPSHWLDRIFAVMAAAPQHTFQVLTKRPSRMADWFRSGPWMRVMIQQPGGYVPREWPLPNVWLGVSIESDAYAWRARMLAQIPAVVRFISAEPLLGPLPSLILRCPRCGGTGERTPYDRDNPCLDCGFRGRLVDWVIAGGESGGPPERRLVERCPDLHSFSHSPDCCNGTGWRLKDEARVWLLDLRDRCQAEGVAFFYKQAGGPSHAAGGRLLDGRTCDEMPTVGGTRKAIRA